jgi:hypothetical protein
MSLYTAGISLSANNTGAFVAFEKIPRKTERTRDAWHDGIKEKEPIYECDFRLVGAELLSSSLPSMLQQISDRLRSEPMLNDTSARIDIGALGRQVLSLFRDQGVSALPVLVAGEKESTDAHGNKVLPLTTLQATATLIIGTDRLQIAQGLVEGPSILHALEKLDALPEIGPARDLGIAAALALHVATTTGGGKWPSSKQKPFALLAEEEAEASQRAMRHAAIRAARRV